LEKWLARAFESSIFGFTGTNKNRLGFYWFFKGWMGLTVEFGRWIFRFLICTIQQHKDATFEAAIK